MIGLDAILLFVLVLRFLASFSTRTSPYVFALEDRLVGFSLIALVVLGAYFAVRMFRGGGKNYWQRLFIVSFLGIFLIGSFLGIQIAVRRQVPHFLYIHDGAVQTEDAIAALRSGENPYSIDYLQRSFGAFPDGFSEATRPNPAWTHYVYPPLQVAFGAPLAGLSERLFGWFDVRFLYLLSFILLIVCGAALAPDGERRLLTLILLTFNPFFIQFFIGGFNDAFFLSWIALGALMLQRKHGIAAATCLGLAFASKQLAWFLLPFFLWHLYVTSDGTRRIGSMIRRAIPALVVIALVVLPFILWSAGDFFDDVVSFATGSASQSYPISGFGLGQLLVSAGAIDSMWSKFPFWIFQVLAGAPLLFVLFRWQRKAPTASRMLAAYGLFAFVMLFLSRYFNDSHLGALSVVFLLSYAASQKDNEQTV